MKPSNFPARVYERRAGALNRLKIVTVGGKDSKLSKMPKMEPEVMAAMIQNAKERIEQENTSLVNSLKIAGSPRSIRTKKSRVGKGKISY